MSLKIKNVLYKCFRTNIWQNELNVASLDDTEDTSVEQQSPTRGQRNELTNSAFVNSMRVLNLSGWFLDN